MFSLRLKKISLGTSITENGLIMWENLILLGLILTYRCLARCRICIVNASRDRTEKMSLKDALTYIDQASTINKIEKIAITGGEPFLHFADLLKIVHHSSKHGLETSVSTNCFWADSKNNAKKRLKKLKEAGLATIRFSVDEFHQEFVPLRNVKNCIEIARDLRIDNIIFQSVVTKNSMKFQDVFKELGDFKGIRAHKISCIPTGRAAEEIPEKDWMILPGIPEERCEEIGKVLLIDPEGLVYPCCSSFTKTLSIGNAKKDSLYEILRKAENNLFLKVLAKQGPVKLAEKVKEYNIKYKFRKGYVNICHLCYSLLSDKNIQNSAVSQIS